MGIRMMVRVMSARPKATATRLYLLAVRAVETGDVRDHGNAALARLAVQWGES